MHFCLKESGVRGVRFPPLGVKLGMIISICVWAEYMNMTRWSVCDYVMTYKTSLKLADSPAVFEEVAIVGEEKYFLFLPF